MDARDILEQVAAGRLDVTQALQQFHQQAEADLGFARVDLDRRRRRGLPEAVYCPGKTPEQVGEILRAMHERGQNVVATRAGPDLYRHVNRDLPAAVYHEPARCITLEGEGWPEPRGLVVVVTAGTADIPVAEEAGVAARCAGARVEPVYDIGVAGLHRLGRRLDQLRRARVLVVAAGMEGALLSVVAGLVSCPVIGVPVSSGYGMNLQGAATLLAMLSSCVPGTTVVNVDNGYGAGVAAAMINRLPGPDAETQP